MKRTLSLIFAITCASIASPASAENWTYMGTTVTGQEYYMDLDSITQSADYSYINYLYMELAPNSIKVVSIEGTCSPVYTFRIVGTLDNGQYREGNSLRLVADQGSMAENMLMTACDIIEWSEEW